MNCEICEKQLMSIESLQLHAHTIEHELEQKFRYTAIFRSVGSFSCTPCAMYFHSLSDIIQHSKSENHKNIQLATGFAFDANSKTSQKFTDPFPKLNYCLLCMFRSFSFASHVTHVKTKRHVENVKSFIRVISGNKVRRFKGKFLSRMLYKKILRFAGIKVIRNACKIIKSVFREKPYKTINNKVNFPYFCFVCNVLFYGPTSYNQHLEGKIHKRIHQFIRKIMEMRGEITYADFMYRVLVLKSLFSSNRPLHCCELCYSWYYNYELYIEHFNVEKHKTQSKLLELSPDIKNKFSRGCLDSYTFVVHLDEKLSSCKICKRDFESESCIKHFKSYFHRMLLRTGFRLYNESLLNPHTKKEKFRSMENSKTEEGGSFCQWYSLKKHSSNFRISKNVLEEDSTYIIPFSLKASEAVGESGPKPYFCIHCGVNCFEVVSYSQHLKGKKHKAIVKCVSGGLNKTNDIKYSCNGDKPLKNQYLVTPTLVKSAGKLTTYSESQFIENLTCSDSVPYHCKPCDVRCLNKKSYFCHLTGNKHLKNYIFLSKLPCKTEGSHQNSSDFVSLTNHVAVTKASNVRAVKEVSVSATHIASQPFDKSRARIKPRYCILCKMYLFEARYNRHMMEHSDGKIPLKLCDLNKKKKKKKKVSKPKKQLKSSLPKTSSEIPIKKKRTIRNLCFGGSNCKKHKSQSLSDLKENKCEKGTTISIKDMQSKSSKNIAIKSTVAKKKHVKSTPANCKPVKNTISKSMLNKAMPAKGAPIRQQNLISSNLLIIECELCAVLFNDSKLYEQHLTTKRHKRMLKSTAKTSNSKCYGIASTSHAASISETETNSSHLSFKKISGSWDFCFNDSLFFDQHQKEAINVNKVDESFEDATLFGAQETENSHNFSLPIFCELCDRWSYDYKSCITHFNCIAHIRKENLVKKLYNGKTLTFY